MLPSTQLSSLKKPYHCRNWFRLCFARRFDPLCKYHWYESFKSL